MLYNDRLQGAIKIPNFGLPPISLDFLTVSFVKAVNIAGCDVVCVCMMVLVGLVWILLVF